MENLWDKFLKVELLGLSVMTHSGVMYQKTQHSRSLNTEGLIISCKMSLGADSLEAHGSSCWGKGCTCVIFTDTTKLLSSEVVLS